MASSCLLARISTLINGEVLKSYHKEQKTLLNTIFRWAIHRDPHLYPSLEAFRQQRLKVVEHAYRNYKCLSIDHTTFQVDLDPQLGSYSVV